MAINLQSSIKGKIVTTSVIQIQVIDEDGKTKTYNLDNPKENLTLDNIRTAFSSAINGRWLLGNSGIPIINVKSANYSIATKTYLDGSEVTVAPNVINITDKDKLSATVYVTGAKIEDVAASPIKGTIDDTTPPADDWLIETEIGSDSILVKLEMNASTGKVLATSNLYISAAGTTITIPININFTF